FRFLSFFQAISFPLAFAVVLMGEPEASISSGMSTLVDATLIESVGERFQMHPLLYEFARELHQTDEAEESQAAGIRISTALISLARENAWIADYRTTNSMPDALEALDSLGGMSSPSPIQRTWYEREVGNLHLAFAFGIKSEDPLATMSLGELLAS